MARKPIKAGVWQGGGPEPGYEWSVGILQLAFEEAMDVTSEAGYCHLGHQFKELAGHSDPTHSETVDVRPIENFHEIRDKSGPLGGANIRVFFGVDSERRLLIVLGVIKKQNNGPTPLGDKVRMRGRWRNYRRGDYGSLSQSQSDGN